MSTINGCGTLLYDWSHLPDGTAHATEWFVIAFLPIAPLCRRHLRVVTSGKRRSFFSLSGKSDWRVEYECFDNVPVQPLGVFKTYLKAYVLLPILMFGPIVAIVAIAMWMLAPNQANGPLMTRDQSIAFVAVLTVAILIYWGWIVARILDRSRGL